MFFKHLNMEKRVFILLFYIVSVETSVGPGPSKFRQQLSRYLPDEVSSNGKLGSIPDSKQNGDGRRYYTSRTFKAYDINDYWIELDDAINHDALPNSYRTAATVKLPFSFDFYGNPIDQVTIATGGFLYMSPFLHQWLTATQYIAPLMGNFEIGNSSDIFYKGFDISSLFSLHEQCPPDSDYQYPCPSTQNKLDQSLICIPNNWVCDQDLDCPEGEDEEGCLSPEKEEKFVVEWRNVRLQDQKDGGSFQFQTIIYKNGSIYFVYKKLPGAVFNISSKLHPVKIGLADAYYYDTDSLGVKRRTIYEYPRVTLNQSYIEEGTVVVMDPVPTYPTCAANQFACNNSRCISNDWVCDRDDDCRDNSDEQNCNSTGSTTTWRPTSTFSTYRPGTCHYWQFRCNNGYCISSSERCDNVDDCGDHSDEMNCAPRTCSSNEWICASHGQCIYQWQHCNGNNDCWDGSDEQYCDFTTTARPCGLMEYMCWNSSNHECIEASSRCDGMQDCDNNEDEQGCGGGMSCNSKTMFKCRLSEGCISRRDVCNEVNNCPDGSDEFGCDNTTAPTNFASCKNPFMFHCKNEDKCTPYMFTCDGSKDCAHGSDENLEQCWDISYKPGTNAIKVLVVGKQNMTVEWDSYGGSVSYIFSYITLLHGAYQGTNVTGLHVTNHTVKGLHPAQKYYVNIYISNSTRIWRPYRKINVTTLDDHPDPPAEVGLNYEQNTETIKVNWHPPLVYKGKIIMYRIYVQEAGSVSNVQYYQDVDTGKDKGFSATLESEQLGLQFRERQNYTVQMTAFTSEGESSKSKRTFVIYRPSCLLSYVGNISATAKKSNSIELKWNPSGAKVDSYKVVYYDVWYVKREMHTKDGTTTSFTVDNLCSDSWYTFGVAPEKQGCVGDTLYISGKTTGTEVGSPTVKVDLVDETAINVSWTAPKGAIPKETYTIFYDYRPEDLHTSVIATRAEMVTTSKKYIIVDKLRACDQYTFRVAATGAGRCPLSVGMSQMTGFDPSAPPEYLEVVANNRTSVTVTWHSSCITGFEALGYIITKKEVFGNKTVEYDEPFTFTNQTEMRLTYRNLIPGATYSFTAKTSDKNARDSETVSITMEAYDAPTDLSHNPTTWNSDSGQLTWKGNHKQIVKGKKFQGYEVLICSVDSNQNDSTCLHKESFKTYGIVQNESIEYKKLTKGRHYIFAVRFNKIDGYSGKMSKFPIFTVPAEENGASASTVTLSKTNIIAIAASGAAVVIALVVILTFFIVRHKRLQRSFRAFASSHYDSRSGTTTFTAADELEFKLYKLSYKEPDWLLSYKGEDEDSPMIRGFSDDEPLVIA